MNQSKDLLNRIRVLEHENSVLQKTIAELQEYQPFYQPSNGIIGFQTSPIEYFDGAFWLQPADNFWNWSNRRTRQLTLQ